MFTINYTHACGHKDAVSSYSTASARHQANYFKHLPCRQCRWAVEHVCAADHARDAGLPALKATPKQVAYAEVLREKRLPELTAALEAIMDDAEGLHQVLYKELDRWCGGRRTEVCARTSAAAWIEGPAHVYDWMEWLHDKAQATGVAPALLDVISSVCGG